MTRHRLLILLGLAVLALAAYARIPSLGFINVDDPAYVTQNRHVLAGPTGEGVAWAFTTFAEANWHPVTWISLMVDAKLGGGGPRAFHLTNLLLHLASTLLLFLAMERATIASGPSAAVAALFAVHPLHVESVAWIAERKDVLSGFFWMAALLAYVVYAERRTVGRYALVVGALALGLMAKPMAVSFPIVALLLDCWPLGRRERTPAARLVWEKVPLALLAAASCAVTLAAQKQAIRPAELYPLGERLANALTSYGHYLVKTIWPVGLAAYYPHLHDRLPVWQPILAGLVLIAVSVVAVRRARALPWLATGWGWFLVTLLPVIGLVQVGSQAMADRYAYIPSIGLYVVIVWGLHALVPRAAGAVLGVAAVVLAALTFVQVGYWKSSLDLFAHAVKVTRNNAVAHANLGLALDQAGRSGEAIPELEMAVTLSPGFADAHFALTRIYLRAGRVGQASGASARELARWPVDERTLVNAGLVEMALGRYDGAIRRFADALRVNPASVDANLNMGSIRAAQGRTDAAISHFRAVLKAEPNDPDARRAIQDLGGAVP